MRIEEKTTKTVSTYVGPDGPINETREDTTTEVFLESGENADTLTPEQKDKLLEMAFLPHGDVPTAPVAPARVRSIQEEMEIAEDLRGLYPKTDMPVLESSMHVATDRLVGPPTEAPRESRVTHTSVDGSSDNLPPALR